MNNIQHVLAIWFLFLLSHSAVAQTPTAQQMERAKEDRQRMTTHLLMQQLMQLQHNRDMHVEVGLVEDQTKSLRQVLKEHRYEMMELNRANHEMREKVQLLMEAGDHEAARKVSLSVQEEQLEVTGQAIEAAKTILLPHQFERLQQIAKQQLAKRANPFQDEFGMAIGMADELGLTEKEKHRLFQAIRRIRKEYYIEIAKLKQKANDDILETIPASKREKLREILGDQFDPDESKRRNADEHRRRREELPQKMRRDRERNPGGE